MLRNLLHNDPTWALFDRQMDWVMKEFARPWTRTEAFGPRLYLHEDEAGVRLQAEVPGLRAEDVEISATRDALTLKGARKVVVAEGQKALRRERPDYTIDSTFRFDDEIDPDRVVAKVENGLLTITAPRAQKTQPKRVTIQAS